MISIVFHICHANGFENDSLELDTVSYTYDTNYIESYYDKFVVTLVNVSDINSIELTNYESETDLSYTTNKVTKWGFGLDYKWLALQFTFPIRSISREDSELGKTKGLGLSFGLTKRRLWFRTFYEKNSGFHVTSTHQLPDIANEWVRPDITSETFYASAYYGFNYRKFSYMAALWQIEKQKKTSATLIGGLSYLRDKISSDSSLVPSVLVPKSEENNKILQSNNHYFLFNIGTAATIVIRKNYFVTASFIPGISYQYGKWKNSENTTFNKNYDWNLSFDMKLGAGYIGNNSFFGFNIFNNNFVTTARHSDETDITRDIVQLRLFAGYRFNGPNWKWLKKIYL